MPPYQDRYVRGQVIARGYRECAARYSLVVRGLGRLRPHSVLDFGAAGGYFSFRMARELGAAVTAVDDSPELIRTAKANGDKRVKIVSRRLALEELTALGCFDVVLALSVLHHVSPWPDYLRALRRAARRLLIVELPDPTEKFARALDPAELAAMHEQVRAMGGRPLGAAPGVWSRERSRGLYALRPAALHGLVFSGSGRCGSWWEALVGPLETVLGYRPIPGSLNLRLDPPDSARELLGPPRRKYWDRRRPRWGKKGGDYWFWPARFGTGSHAIEGHVMLPGVRGHGPDCLELVAPIKLRDAWDLKDGDRLWIKVR